MAQERELTPNRERRDAKTTGEDAANHLDLKFVVLNRMEAEEYADCGAPYIVISIASPGCRQARLPAPPLRRGVLYLVFDDCEADADTGYDPAEELKPMRSDQAAAIWKFVLQHLGKVSTIVVHCEAGLSRSPAVAAALCRRLGGDDGWFFDRYLPNNHVYHLVARAEEGI